MQRPGFNSEMPGGNHKARFGFCWNTKSQVCDAGGDNGDSDGCIGIGLTSQKVTNPSKYGKGVGAGWTYYITDSHNGRKPAWVYVTLKVCTCANGAVATGEVCPAHNQEFCASCNADSTMVDNVCIVNISCDDGFSNLNGVCVETTCTCENGVFATGSSCPLHGSPYCSSCDENYVLGLDLESNLVCNLLEGSGEGSG